MKYLIAFSGGLDSMVLLHLFRQEMQHINVRAIHVHHGLQPQADAWQQHCQQICDTWKIPLEIVKLSLQIKPGESLEAVARNARYTAFQASLQPDEILVTAHHQNDQAETVLLHALRGAGPQGLAAMPEFKKFAATWHWRPLLTFTRQSLIDYAQQQQLTWVEDGSNENLKFDRNFLRHEIIKRLDERWPKAVACLARVAEIQADLSNFLDELLQPTWQQLSNEIEKIDANSYYKNSTLLPLSLLNNLPATLQDWFLRDWLKKNTQIILTRKQLYLIYQDLIFAKIDKQPEFKLGNYLLHRYADALWLTPLSIDKKILLQKATQEKNWLAKQFNLNPDLLEVRYRQGGEHFHPQGRQHSQTLKKLLQEWKIPPWERDLLPLVYYQGELIGVAGRHPRHVC